MEVVSTAKIGVETVVRNSAAAPGAETKCRLRALRLHGLLCALRRVRTARLLLVSLLLLPIGMLLLFWRAVLLLLLPAGLLLMLWLLLWSLSLLLLMLLLLFRGLGLLLLMLRLLLRSLSLLLMLLLLFRSLSLLLMLRLLFRSLRLLLRAWPVHAVARACFFLVVFPGGHWLKRSILVTRMR